MSKTNRLLALLVLLAFSTSLASALYRAETEGAASTASAVGLLPAAVADPIDVAFEDTLRAGETLSELLARADLAQGEVDALLAELLEHEQDPRRMRAGSIFAFRRSLEDGALRRMQLRLDADRTLDVLRKGSSWRGAIAQVPVEVDTVIISGAVESTLYGALMEGDAGGIPTDERERVVDLLADRIFAWEIDFSRDLRTGDRFRILYERLVRPDGTARTGRVLGVQFHINGQDHEAYAFAAGDGSVDYYDREGESLRRAFLRAPLQYRRISSAFSRGRFHPILKVSRPHNGIDYAAASGTPIYAVGDGTVRRASGGGDYGNVVEIRHTRGYSTRYAHLRGFAAGIRAGVRVKQGDIIGYVGQTGLATGPHLHYEFHSAGRAVDPNSISNITGDPVPGQYLQEFVRVMGQHVASLDRASGDILLAENAREPAARLGD
jgi:murein DD-endopeptidase MepM/ murein hydrolase activator NlpD